MNTRLSLSLLSLCAIAPLGSLLARDHHPAPISFGFPVPNGYVEVRVGQERYFSHRGVYYRPGPHGFVVCPPPRGAVLRVLPPHFTRVYVGDVLYYRYGGVYYRPAIGGYVVVEAPKVVIPSEASVNIVEQEQPVTVGNTSYVFRDGQFFQRTSDGLVWVPAPVGAVLSALPKDADSIWYQDIEYFDCDGVIFRKTPRGYAVVEAPWKR